MMTGLRQIAGVDLAVFRGRFAEEAESAFPHLARLVCDGLLERRDERLRLTSSGLRFADDVAATFV
jgi:coproporphyrinogen III oxidase-like Fe-S oxidoreductase